MLGVKQNLNIWDLIRAFPCHRPLILSLVQFSLIKSPVQLSSHRIIILRLKKPCELTFTILLVHLAFSFHY